MYIDNVGFRKIRLWYGNCLQYRARLNCLQKHWFYVHLLSDLFIYKSEKQFSNLVTCKWKQIILKRVLTPYCEFQQLKLRKPRFDFHYIIEKLTRFPSSAAIGCHLQNVTILSTPPLYKEMVESVKNTIPTILSIVIRCILNVLGDKWNATRMQYL